MKNNILLSKRSKVKTVHTVFCHMCKKKKKKECMSIIAYICLKSPWKDTLSGYSDVCREGNWVAGNRSGREFIFTSFPL